MPQDETPKDEKKPDLPVAAETAEAASNPPVSPAEPQAPHELKGGNRRKTGESREHKESKDQNKIKFLKAEIEELKKEIEAKAAEAEAARDEAKAARRDAGEWKDRTLRTLADTDNLRKRLDREKAEYFQFSLAEVLKDVLHVIDNLDRAMKAQDASEGVRAGIEMIRKQMFDLAAKRGVTPIECPDGKFDPSFHQALLTEEADGIEEPMIAEELQKGYMLNDRLLRPTLVKVLLPRK